MKPINIEKLMNHSVGISDSYYRATEQELLQDYLHAIEYISINGNEMKLTKEVEELREKSRENEYIIRGKLQEKDKHIKVLMNQTSGLIEKKSNLLKNENLSSLSGISITNRERI
ncbi:MAG: hypothetical protein ACRD97_13085 [Nitrososphaeraceae archaeon]